MLLKSAYLLFYLAVIGIYMLLKLLYRLFYLAVYGIYNQNYFYLSISFIFSDRFFMGF